MRVEFPRLPDGRRAHCVVERSDGVRYRVREGVAGPKVPHDLVHLVVERETEEDGGFWGAVAAGAVFATMDHLDGRRPPHAARLSREVIRARAGTGRLQRAELMADLVERVLGRRIEDVARVRAAAAEVLATLPDARVDEERILAAAAALRETAAQWQRLAPGQALVVEWPERADRRRGAGRPGRRRH
ncbi:hypothetical protein ACFV3R_28335 [Streptomyces sp. NPDC059740]|uniref:hypothetical protein n=1 Tax=Streptomyces sp. NPDC059740 TaxID=3346926 RepID=UPI0036593536